MRLELWIAVGDVIGAVLVVSCLVATWARDIGKPSADSDLKIDV